MRTHRGRADLGEVVHAILHGEQRARPQRPQNVERAWLGLGLRLDEILGGGGSKGRVVGAKAKGGERVRLASRKSKHVESRGWSKNTVNAMRVCSAVDMWSAPRSMASMNASMRSPAAPLRGTAAVSVLTCRRVGEI